MESRYLVRLNCAQRQQVQWRDSSLDQLLPADHRARVVWRYVETLDLDRLYAKISAVPGQGGRNAVDPRILMALWLFAITESISSARHLARLCERDLAYMWICGEVSVNHHMLSDFRTEHGEFLEELLTTTVAALIHANVITLETVAQDGMRVRAHAGSSSFHRAKTLDKCVEQAREHIRKLKEEGGGEQEGSAPSLSQVAARERAAREQLERAEQALTEVLQLQAEKEASRKGTGQKARASTTDPEARIMKMGDSGFRPAYNVQLATDGGTRIIVQVDVTNDGNDSQQMAPMQTEIVTDYDKPPEKYLVDCGFINNEQLAQMSENGSSVYGPIHAEKSMIERGSDPYARKKRDNDATFAFRQRMQTEEAKEIYKLRPSIAEFPNAEFRNRGLTQFRVRGRLKAKAVALWHALAFNFMRMVNLNLIT